MNSKLERICAFLISEKGKDISAFIFYVLFVISLMELNLPLFLQIIIFIVGAIMFSVFYSVYLCKITLTFTGVSFKKIFTKLKKIILEIIAFYIFLKITGFLQSYLLTGIPQNQVSIESTFYNDILVNSISIIILGPIIEEIIFRYLPFRFIKNAILYVLISSVIFAAMHVINYPNALYFIWFYLPNSLYYGYRYCKTKDLLVTISLHCFNNLIATLPLILVLF